MNGKKMTLVCLTAIGMALVLAPVGTAAPLGGEAIWLTADTGVTVVAGKVTTWADQSGNSRDFATTIGPGALDTDKIYYTPSWGPLGKPAVLFGSDDQTRMTGPDFDFTDWTMFAVIQAETQNPSWGGTIWGDTGTNTGAGTMSHVDLEAGSGHDDTAGWYAHERNFDNTADLYAGYQSGGANNNKDILPEIISGAFDSTAKTLYLWSQRGGLLGSAYDVSFVGVSKSGDGPPTLGVAPRGDGGINGHIAEFILYTTKLSDADRLSVESYLYNKYIVPEPSSVLILSSGLLAILLFGYRRRRTAA